MKKYFVGCAAIFFLFNMYVFEAGASTTVLANCSQSIVSNAIGAASDGDTIVCPSGTWSWASSVTINNKNITLQGAGSQYWNGSAKVGSDLTTINVTSSGTPAIYVPSSNTKPFRITGINFHATVLLGEDHGDGIIRNLSTGVGGNGNGWRIDHCKFQQYTDSATWNGGSGGWAGGNAIVARGSVGLVDHNIFTPAPESQAPIHASVYMSGPGTGESQWASAGGISSGNAMYIEDNIFEETGTSHYTCTSAPGSCWVHNGHTVDAGPGMYVFRHNTVYNMNTDAHGFCSLIGTREYEISNNDFYVTADSLWALVEIRGGTGVIYNNTNHGPYSPGAPLWMVEYRVNDAGSCGGVTQNGVSSSSTCNSYPCIDQIGRGQNQTSDKLYIWGNSGNFSISNDDPSYIQSGRDYVLNGGAKPGYTPYPYPHPMVSGGGGGQQSNLVPNPPTNIQIK